jgi:hypothetical protein
MGGVELSFSNISIAISFGCTTNGGDDTFRRNSSNFMIIYICNVKVFLLNKEQESSEIEKEK